MEGYWYKLTEKGREAVVLDFLEYSPYKLTRFQKDFMDILGYDLEGFPLEFFAITPRPDGKGVYGFKKASSILKSLERKGLVEIVY